MKITKVSCDQFAGMRDRSVSFADGLNVVYGRNESGKSTLVGLIGRTLFQPAKLDRRKDKGFFERYFPAEKRGKSGMGDCIDGSVGFETDDGAFTLKKEWGEEPSCRLLTPDDTVKKQETIDELLRAALVYGEGVYSELLLSTQSGAEVALLALLDADKPMDAKRELADVVSKAFAESDGVSVEAVATAIAAKIEELAGEHWDEEAGRPEYRKDGARYKQKVGAVMEAYYAWQDAVSALERVRERETALERAAATCAERETALAAAEAERERFLAFAGRLENVQLRQERLETIEKQQREQRQALETWPRTLAARDKARALQSEREARETLDRYQRVCAAEAELTEGQRRMLSLPRPTDEELATVRTLVRQIAARENALCGMNLQAAVTMLGGHTVRFESLRTGEAIDPTAITEAVRITVPGVMELSLAPANVALDAVQAELTEKKEALAAVLAAYAVTTVEALETYVANIDSARAKERDVAAKIARECGDMTAEELKARYAAVSGEVRDAETIGRELTALGARDVQRFIADAEATVRQLEAKYGSIEALKAAAFDLSLDYEAARTAAAEAADIPDEYRGVTDVEAKQRMLAAAVDACRAARDEAFTVKERANAALSQAWSEEISDEAVAQRERELEEKKALLRHWRHIDAVFRAKKDALEGSPMAGLTARFAEYLEVLSGGRVQPEFPEQDKLGMTLYSADRRIGHGTLSEGTKDTVSLAFRLAVVDHLFPDGGGVIVLDDPLTDMDAEREALSVAMIKACAERHQVIFLTCKEELATALGGTLIRF